MAKWYAPEVRRTIRQLFAEERYDLVICDFLHPAGVLPWPAPCPTVLFTHNIEAEVWERQQGVTSNLSGVWRTGWSTRRSPGLSGVTSAWPITSSPSPNATPISSAGWFPADKVSVVPTGVDTEYFQPAPDLESREPEMVFTASMDWMPNEDAVLYFARDIFPLVRREIPEARFWAVGRNPSPAVRALDDGAPLRVTGSVEDIRPYLHRSAV